MESPIKNAETSESDVVRGEKEIIETLQKEIDEVRNEEEVLAGLHSYINSSNIAETNQNEDRLNQTSTSSGEHENISRDGEENIDHNYMPLKNAEHTLVCNQSAINIQNKDRPFEEGKDLIATQMHFSDSKSYQKDPTQLNAATYRRSSARVQDSLSGDEDSQTLANPKPVMNAINISRSDKQPNQDHESEDSSVGSKGDKSDGTIVVTSGEDSDSDTDTDEENDTARKRRRQLAPATLSQKIPSRKTMLLSALPKDPNVCKNHHVSLGSIESITPAQERINHYSTEYNTTSIDEPTGMDALMSDDDEANNRSRHLDAESRERNQSSISNVDNSSLRGKLSKPVSNSIDNSSNTQPDLVQNSHFNDSTDVQMSVQNKELGNKSQLSKNPNRLFFEPDDDFESIAQDQYDSNLEFPKRHTLLDSLLRRKNCEFFPAEQPGCKTSNHDHMFRMFLLPSQDSFTVDEKRKRKQALFSRVFHDAIGKTMNLPTSTVDSERCLAYCTILAWHLERALHEFAYAALRKKIHTGTREGNDALNEADQRYHEKGYSLYVNLKDKSNPTLVARVLVRELDVKKLVRMSPEEIASKFRREIKEKYAAEVSREYILGPSDQVILPNGLASDKK